MEPQNVLGQPGSAQRQRAWQLFLVGLVLMDALALALALALAGWVYPGRGASGPGRLLGVAAGFIPLLVLILWVQGAYQRRYLLGGPGEYSRVVGGCSYGVLALIAVSYFAGGEPLVSRGWLVLSWGLSIGFVGLGRFLMRRVAYRLRHWGYFVTRALLAGVDAHSAAIARQLHNPLDHGTAVLGFLDDFLPEGTVVVAADNGNTPTTLAVLGAARSVRDIAQRLEADLVIVNPRALAWESTQQLVLQTANQRDRFETRLVPLPYDLLAVGVETTSLAYVPLLRLEERRITGIDALLKNALDMTVAGALLALGLPFVAVAVLRARLRGVKPVLERRVVLGRAGVPVPLVVLSHQVSQRLLLRGWPALWAVLRGHLSLVGRRPRPPEEQDARRWMGIVQAVKPGLTGPWRFLEREATFSPEQQLAQDLWYIRNYTIWQDFFFLWQTARATLPLGRKAQRTRLWRWELGERGEFPERQQAESLEVMGATRNQ